MYKTDNTRKPISYYTSKYRKDYKRGGYALYPKYQTGDSVNASTLVELLKGLGKEGTGVKDIFSSVSSGSISGMGGITAGLTGAMSGLGKLTDNNARNDGSGTGQLIGSAVDSTLGAFGIPTFGLVGKAGEVIGSEFNNDRMSSNYSPSGNVIGQWKDFKYGGLTKAQEGMSSFQQGLYGSNPRPLHSDGKEYNYSTYYMPPERKKYLRNLEDKYNLPSGILESIAFAETAKVRRDSRSRDKHLYKTKDKTVSGAGAAGPFQFTLPTAKDYNLSPQDRFDFYKSADAAAKKISEDYKYFNKNIDDTIAAYNWGRRANEEYKKGIRDKLPEETKTYRRKVKDNMRKVMGFESSVPYDAIPTVTAPRSLDRNRANASTYPTDSVDYPQLDKYYKLKNNQPPFVNYSEDSIDFTNPTRMQKGGNANIDPRAKIEIEGGEYVFNPEGLNENSFKMLDNTGKKHVSSFGFLAQGKDHDPVDNSAGIKVMEGDAYIASKYLGLDGKKSGKGNPSVASNMMKYGGKALGKGEERSWDRFAINKHNPNALKHHLSLMDKVKRKAEANKLKEKIRKGETSGIEASMKKGGITSSSAILSPSPASFLKKIPGAYVKEKKLSQDIKNTYNQSMERYPEREYRVYKSGGDTDTLDDLPFDNDNNPEDILYSAPDLPTAVVTAKRKVQSRDVDLNQLTNYTTPDNTFVNISREINETIVAPKPSREIDKSSYDFDWTNPTAIANRSSKPKGKAIKKLDINIIDKSSDDYKAAQRDSQGNVLRNPNKEFTVLHKTGVVYEGTDFKPRYIEEKDFYTGANIWIKKDGTIVKTADEDVVVNHGGGGMLPGTSDVNAQSIGIEFEAAGIPKEKSKYSGEYEKLTKEQLESGSKYLANWIIENGWSLEEGLNRIFGHHEITQFNPFGEGYLNPRTVRSNPRLQRYGRKRFGEERLKRFYNTSRKPDFNVEDMSEMRDMIKKQLVKAGYDIKGAPFVPFKPNSNNKKKLGGYSNYKQYYESLPYDIKYVIAKKLNTLPKQEMGGKLADMLDEMYMNEEYIWLDGSEGI